MIQTKLENIVITCIRVNLVQMKDTHPFGNIKIEVYTSNILHLKIEV